MKINTIIFLFFMTICSVNACGQNSDSTSSALTSLLKDTVKNEPIDDSLMFKALGDSICDIILNAKSVEASLINFADSTASNVNIQKKLDKEQMTILQFLISNPKNFASNATVYGQFLPNISFTFFGKKKECIIKFDFGLRKLCVYDQEGNYLKMFDLSSTEILRFAHTLFPENEFYVKLLNYKKK